LFTRLYYYAKVQLRLDDEEFWMMPIGAFLDLWTCHKQFLGIEKPKRIVNINDIIPLDCE
jgi:hypothetical protein